jgi:hypothetical protein
MPKKIKLDLNEFEVLSRFSTFGCGNFLYSVPHPLPRRERVRERVIS